MKYYLKFALVASILLGGVTWWYVDNVLPQFYPAEEAIYSAVKEDGQDMLRTEAQRLGDRMERENNWDEGDRVNLTAWHESRLGVAKEGNSAMNAYYDVLATTAGTSTVDIKPEINANQPELQWIADVYAPRHIWIDDGSAIRVDRRAAGYPIVRPDGYNPDIHQDGLAGNQTITMHDRLVHEYHFGETEEFEWISNTCAGDDCDAVVRRLKTGEYVTLHDVGKPLGVVAKISATGPDQVVRTTAVVQVSTNAVACPNNGLGGQLTMGINNFSIRDQLPDSGIKFLEGAGYKVHVVDDQYARDVCRSFPGVIIARPQGEKILPPPLFQNPTEK